MDIPAPEDNAHILIDIKLSDQSLSDQTKAPVLKRILDRIKRVETLCISDNPSRFITVRYVVNYSSQLQKWGDFQVHRRAVGLIYVCALDSPLPNSDARPPRSLSTNAALSSTVANEESKNRSYSMLDDSKNSAYRENVVVGNDSRLNSAKEEFSKATASYGSSLYDCKCFLFGGRSVNQSNGSHGAERKNSERDNSRANVVCYVGLDDPDCDLEDQVRDLVHRLFWILESKRLDRSFEKQNSELLSCPSAPGEEKYRIGLDSKSSKNYKKRCNGRYWKLVADYCLLAGLPYLAIDSYLFAAEQLKSINDWLWLAGSYEGYACAATVMRYSSERGALHRVATFSPGQMAKAASKAKNDTLKSNSLTKKPSSILTDSRALSKEIPNDKEILEKYLQAIENYQKFSFASCIELECILKAAKVYVYEQRYLEASNFLQSSTEKFLRPGFLLFDSTAKAYLCNSLAAIFKEMGCLRKVSFYSRLTAMYRLKLDQSDISLSQADHRQAYLLYLSSLEGYNLPLNPKDFVTGEAFGWPGIQIRVLNEIFIIAKRSGYLQLADRHLRYLIQLLGQHVPSLQLESFIKDLIQLRLSATKAQLHMQTPGGFILPPVFLTDYPIIKCIDMVPLQPCMVATHVLTSSSVFIYTPFAKKSSNKVWVAQCAAEVQLVISNKVNLPLSVENFVLQCDGCNYEVVPVAFTMEPLQHRLEVSVPLIPREAGVLTITGYSLTVFGISNACKIRDCKLMLDDASSGHKSSLCVDVCPPMPVLDIASTMPSKRIPDSALEICSVDAVVYYGERFTTELALRNVSGVSIDTIDVSIVTTPYLLLFDTEPLISSDTKNMIAGLSISSGSSVSLPVAINGAIMDEEAKTTFCSNMDDSSNCPSQTERKFRVELFFSYGSSVEHKSKDGVSQFRRRCSAVFHITLIPCVLLKCLSVLPGDSATSRYLTLQLMNMSTYDLVLSPRRETNVHVEPLAVCSLAVPFNVLSNCCKVHVPKSLPSCAQLKDLLILWSMADNQRSGFLPIWCFLVSETIIKQMTVPSVICDAVLNGQPCTKVKDTVYGVGEVINVELYLERATMELTDSLVVFLCFYNDIQNKASGKRSAESYVLPVGISRRVIRFSENQQCQRVFFSFMLLSEGTFVLDVMAKLFTAGAVLNEDVCVEAESIIQLFPSIILSASHHL